MDILIPLDFNAHAEFIVKQAIELSASGITTIHLLHVIEKNKNNSSSSVHLPDGSNKNSYADKLMHKLTEWKQCIKETIPDCKVKGYLVEGNVHDAIILAAKEIKPQLIIIGKKTKSAFWQYYLPVTADEIAKKSKCPVLTVTTENKYKKITTIVLPVRSFIPIRKIELLVMFAKIYRIKIHVVALKNKMGNTDRERKVLSETYQILRNGLISPVEYHLLNGRNLAKSVAAYAMDIQADLLLVNPFAETSISFFTGRHITDILPQASNLKILSVVPYHQQ